MQMNDVYKEFISTCKTERECISYVENVLKVNGFKDLKNKGSSNKFYLKKMDKTLAAFKIGK